MTAETVFDGLLVRSAGGNLQLGEGSWPIAQILGDARDGRAETEATLDDIVAALHGLIEVCEGQGLPVNARALQRHTRANAEVVFSLNTFTLKTLVENLVAASPANLVEEQDLARSILAKLDAIEYPDYPEAHLEAIVRATLHEAANAIVAGGFDAAHAIFDSTIDSKALTKAVSIRLGGDVDPKTEPDLDDLGPYADDEPAEHLASKDEETGLETKGP